MTYSNHNQSKVYPIPLPRALSQRPQDTHILSANFSDDCTGAKFYYLRTVLHDWSDHKCREILQNIIASMGPDSAILLDEMVLPDTRVHWQAAQVDLTMMAALGARERTRTQWTVLLDSVGLEIAATRTYTPSVNESIMTVVRKS